MNGKGPKVFISYSHDSQDHIDWVLSLAATLENHGLTAIIDQRDYTRKLSWPAFMAQSIHISDFCLLICTQTYKRKAESLQGSTGVGTEAVITLQNFYQNPEKYIPICKDSPEKSIPYFLSNFQYYNFSDQYKLEENLTLLLNELNDKPSVVFQLDKKDNLHKPKVIKGFESGETIEQLAANTRSNISKLSEEFHLFLSESSSRETNDTFQYIPPKISEPKNDDQNWTLSDSNNYIKNFINSHSKDICLILGEYGSGKSTFSIQITTEISNWLDENNKRYLPILLQCKKATRINLDRIEEWIESLLISTYGANPRYQFSWDISWGKLLKLNKTEKVILLIDGFDELAVGDRLDWKVCFEKLTDFLSENSLSAIILSRPNCFTLPSEAAWRTYSSPLPMIRQRCVKKLAKNVKIGFLQEFGDKDICDYIANSPLSQTNAKKLQSIIQKKNRLENLAKKPLFTNLLVQLGPDIVDSDFTILDIYDSIVNSWTTTGREQNSLNPRSIILFLEELSFYLFITNEREIDYNNFRSFANNIDADKQIETDKSIVFLETSTLLIKTAAGKLAFSHNTILEYFVSQKLFKEMVKYKNSNLYVKLLSDPINQFLIEKLDTVTPTQTDTKELERMSHVGSDKNYDNVIGVETPDFHIDNAPVTNREYSEFIQSNPGMIVPFSESRSLLNDLMDREELDWSVANVDSYLEACEQFCWDPTYREFPLETPDHPVIYVSYFDAWLYARFKGKSIPRFSEWLKAALWNPQESTFSWPLDNTEKTHDDFCLDGKTSGPISILDAQGYTSYYGINGALGNVAEWCIDWANERETFLIIAGGGWHFSRSNLKETLQSYSLPNLRRNFVGFRCVSRRTT